MARDSGDPNLRLPGCKGPRHVCNDFADTTGRPNDWHSHGTSYHQPAGDYRKAHPERLPPKRDRCTATAPTPNADWPDESANNWHCDGDIFHSHGLYEGVDPQSPALIGRGAHS